MMRSTVFIKALLLFLSLSIGVSSWAAPVVTSVIVEIETTNMREETVENVISEPIEILLGSLDDVLMVSANYRRNEAIINVMFTQTTDKQVAAEVLVSRVKTTIDSYMDKLPPSIDSISISLANPLPSMNDIDTDSEIVSATEDVKALALPIKPKKNSRNKNASSQSSQLASDTQASTKSLSGGASKASSKPNVIRRVEKRTMTGRYLGSIQSSNEYLPIITTLIPVGTVGENRAVGKYFMSEQDEIVRGEISDCHNNTGNVLTCQWRDKYGAGGVDFIFVPDYTSFSGRWSINGQEGAYKWSGLKVKDN